MWRQKVQDINGNKLTFIEDLVTVLIFKAVRKNEKTEEKSIRKMRS